MRIISGMRWTGRGPDGTPGPGATLGPLTTRSWWFECVYDLKCSTSYSLEVLENGRWRISPECPEDM